jgi:hypothetical protein
LRLPWDFEDVYRRRVGAAEALNLPLALAIAVAARSAEPGRAGASVAPALLQAARRLTPSLDPEIVDLVVSRAQG